MGGLRMRANQGGRTKRLMWVVPTAALAVLASAGGVAAAPSAGSGAWPAIADGTISTIAGGVGGPAKATGVSLSTGTYNDGFYGPCGAAVAGQNVYLADQDTVRMVNSQTGRLTTPAGDGVGASYQLFGAATGNGLPAGDTRLYLTCVVAAGPHGLLALQDFDAVY